MADYVDALWAHHQGGEAAEPRVRVVYLCNPHNPVGRAYTRSEIVALLARLVRRAPDDIVNLGGIEVVALCDGLQDCGRKMLRVHMRQCTATLLANAARGAASVDDEGFGHGVSPGVARLNGRC